MRAAILLRPRRLAPSLRTFAPQTRFLCAGTKSDALAEKPLTNQRERSAARTAAGMPCALPCVPLSSLGNQQPLSAHKADVPPPRGVCRRQVVKTWGTSVDLPAVSKGRRRGPPGGNGCDASNDAARRAGGGGARRHAARPVQLRQEQHEPGVPVYRDGRQGRRRAGPWPVGHFSPAVVLMGGSPQWSTFGRNGA